MEGNKIGARSFPCNSRFRWISNKHCSVHRLDYAKDS